MYLQDLLFALGYDHWFKPLITGTVLASHFQWTYCSRARERPKTSSGIEANVKKLTVTEILKMFEPPCLSSLQRSCADKPS